MRISSRLLSALGVSSDRVMPENGDTELHIPPTIVPVISLRGVTSLNGDVVRGSATNPARDGFVLSLNSFIDQNTAAQGVDLAHVAPGFWGFWTGLTLVTDYSSTLSATADVRLQVEGSESAITNRLISLWAKNTIAIGYWTEVFIIGAGRWNFTLQIAATGAAQHMSIGFVMNATRFNA